MCLAFPDHRCASTLAWALCLAIVNPQTLTTEPIVGRNDDNQPGLPTALTSAAPFERANLKQLDRRTTTGSSDDATDLRPARSSEHLIRGAMAPPRLEHP